MLSPTRFQTLSLSVSVLLMLAKVIAWWMTNSHAIFSDAGESLINVLAGGFALFSLYQAKKPKDRDHPYGHGKVEFISALFEALLIIGAGGAIIAKAVQGLIDQPQLEQLGTGILIAGVAGLVNFLLGLFAQRIGKRNNSATLVADGKHLMTDTWSSVAMVLGLGVVHFSGIIWLDPLIALLMGAFIIVTGIKVLRRSIGGIMDEADEELLEEIIKALAQEKRENWVDFHNLRVIQFGANLHVDCHLTVPWYLTVREAHNELEKVERIVNERTERRVEFFIHTDPCAPSQCGICEKTDCPVRQHPFEGRVSWDLEKMLMDRKHDTSDLTATKGSNDR